ncbi:MAG TPA: hypothetical protein P5250_04725 [Bacteroidales bacterium]|nr:hypothetical protein [Bacteroidales bacterium]
MFILLFYTHCLKCQEEEEDTLSSNEYVYNDSIIDIYDKYNVLLGGDSVRKCGAKPCNGWVIDYYANGKILHKGFYNKGKLNNLYTNYYPDGTIERTFRIKSPLKAIMEVFYKNGNLMSKTYYYKGIAIATEEYYPNGKKEFEEKFNKQSQYHIYFNFYYPNGNPNTMMILKNKKKGIYSYTSYYPNGKIKEDGTLIFNWTLNDYIRYGLWKNYDKTGNLIRTDYYVKGTLTDPGEN